MAGPRSEQEAIAEKRAREEAERARKAEIQEMIDQWNTELKKCESLKTSFESEKSLMSNLQAQIMEIHIKDSLPSIGAFHGVTAGAVNEGAENAEHSLMESILVIADVVRTLGSQIGMLDSYIIELNSRIETLQGKL